MQHGRSYHLGSFVSLGHSLLSLYMSCFCGVCCPVPYTGIYYISGNCIHAVCVCVCVFKSVHRLHVCVCVCVRVCLFASVLKSGCYIECYDIETHHTLPTCRYIRSGITVLEHTGPGPRTPLPLLLLGLWVM